MKNHKTKNFLIIGTVFCALGTVLFASGIAAGGREYIKNTDLNMYFKENHHTAIIKKEDWIKVQKLLSERHSTAKRATLRRLSNHFVAYRVKDGLFKGYLIMDSRWSFMDRQEFIKNVDEAQNTIK